MRTFKLMLCPATQSPAFTTNLTGERWVDKLNPNAFQLCLVGDERLQLGIRPTVLLVVYLMTNLWIRMLFLLQLLLSVVLQPFKTNHGDALLNSLIYYSTRNFVVDVTNIIPQSDTRLFSLVFPELISLVDNTFTTKEPASGSDCYVVNTTIHPHHPETSCGFLFVLSDQMAVPLPFTVLEYLDVEQSLCGIQLLKMPLGQNQWKVSPPKPQNTLEVLDMHFVLPEYFEGLAISHHRNSDTLSLLRSEGSNTFVSYPLNTLGVKFRPLSPDIRIGFVVNLLFVLAERVVEDVHIILSDLVRPEESVVENLLFLVCELSESDFESLSHHV